MTLFDQVSSDIRTAMKAHDKVRVETLRNIKKYFLEAKTAPGANDTLEDDAALKILQKLGETSHVPVVVGLNSRNAVDNTSIISMKRIL